MDARAAWAHGPDRRTAGQAGNDDRCSPPDLGGRSSALAGRPARRGSPARTVREPRHNVAPRNSPPYRLAPSSEVDTRARGDPNLLGSRPREIRVAGRSSKMRRVAFACIGLLLVAACGGGGSGGTNNSGTPQKGGTATIALESELRTLDPLDSSLLVEREVFYNMYDSLFTIDPTLKIKAGLVKTWDVSDPLNYKFTLQSGIKYHDGTAFNAASVKANIERYKTAANSRRKSDPPSF